MYRERSGYIVNGLVTRHFLYDRILFTFDVFKTLVKSPNRYFPKSLAWNVHFG